MFFFFFFKPKQIVFKKIAYATRPIFSTVFTRNLETPVSLDIEFRMHYRQKIIRSVNLAKPRRNFFTIRIHLERLIFYTIRNCASPCPPRIISYTYRANIIGSRRYYYDYRRQTFIFHYISTVVFYSAHVLCTGFCYGFVVDEKRDTSPRAATPRADADDDPLVRARARQRPYLRRCALGLRKTGRRHSINIKKKITLGRVIKSSATRRIV